MGERKYVYRVLVGSRRERDHLEDSGVDGRIILRCTFRKWDGGRNGMDWIDLAQDRDRWRALVKAVMNLRVPFHSHNPRTSCHDRCPFRCLTAFPVLPFTTVFQVRLHVYKHCPTSPSLLTSYVTDALLFTPTRRFTSSQIGGTGLIPDRMSHQHCLAAAMTS